MDKVEYVIIRIVTAHGNTASWETLQFFVQFEDNGVERVPDSVAYVTEAFEVSCSGYIFGTSLLLTRKDLATYMREQRPDSTAEHKQTVHTKMSNEWKPEDTIHLTERRYLTTHYWNNADWHVTQDADILPNTIRHREAVLICEVVKITDMRIDLHLPDLAVHTRAKTTRLQEPLVSCMPL